MKYEPLNPHIVLEQGEKICINCNGWGYLKSDENEKDSELTSLGHIKCPNCLGNCTLKFIDAAVGHNRDPRWA